MKNWYYMKMLVNILLRFSTLVMVCGLCAGERIRVLIGSPVCKKPAVVREFLDSLRHLKQDSVSLSYLFIDDNREKESSLLLENFAREVCGCTVLKGWGARAVKEKSSTGHHYWDLAILRKVTEFKDFIIDAAIKDDYDYLFLTDSDQLLNPWLIEHLVSCNKDIVAEIIWTRYPPATKRIDRWPNVWLCDAYTLTPEFLHTIRQSGVHKIGMMGACSLTSKKALHAGVRFKQLKNLSLWGEDRHFCVRAAALGFEIFVDTHYPIYHIYWDSDMDGVEQFKKENGYYGFGL